jgi:hypothetical protein
MRPVSKKRQAELRKYRKLERRLRSLCDNLSELSGRVPDWQTDYLVEGHHIGSRSGAKVYDPFNVIMLTRDEHTAIEREQPIDGHKYTKGELLDLARRIRIKQGFKEASND